MFSPVRRSIYDTFKLMFGYIYSYIAMISLILSYLLFTCQKYLLYPFIQIVYNDKMTNDKETRTHNKLSGKTKLTRGN